MNVLQNLGLSTLVHRLTWYIRSPVIATIAVILALLPITLPTDAGPGSSALEMAPDPLAPANGDGNTLPTRWDMARKGDDPRYLLPNLDGMKIANGQLTREKIQAFGDLPLGDRKLLDREPCIRIFLGTNDKHPLLLKLFRYKKPWRLVCIRLELENQSWRMAEKTEKLLSSTQQSLLETALDKSANISQLTCVNWREGFGMYDGSFWVYEVPTIGGSRILTRYDYCYGVPDGLLEKMNVSTGWYSREMSLQSATMMLWSMSGIGGEPFEPLNDE